jgi:hypothetical protein
MEKGEEMRNVLIAVWRFARVFIGAMVGIYLISPPDKFLSKELLGVALGAGIVAISKYIRNTWRIDVKIV